MNRRRANIQGFAMLLCYGGARVLGQLPVPPAGPAPPPLGPLDDGEFRLPLDIAEAANVDRLIPLLASPDYKQREAATTSLIASLTTCFSSA